MLDYGNLIIYTWWGDPKDYCTRTRPKQTPKMMEVWTAMIDGWNFWCQALNGTNQTASVTSWLLQHSPELIIISVHSDHPRDWRRKNKTSNRSLAPVPSLPPRTSGADCGKMNKLTWLFWARRQMQTCQWSRGERQATETPQRPSWSLFFSRFPYSWTESWISYCRYQ